MKWVRQPNSLPTVANTVNRPSPWLWNTSASPVCGSTCRPALSRNWSSTSRTRAYLSPAARFNQPSCVHPAVADDRVAALVREHLQPLREGDAGLHGVGLEVAAAERVARRDPVADEHAA